MENKFKKIYNNIHAMFNSCPLGIQRIVELNMFFFYFCKSI